MNSINSDRLIGLDFETYGEVNLPVHGLERYASSPHFQPLIASVSALHEQTLCYDFVQKDFDAAMFENFILGTKKFIVAHNAGFEQRVLKAMGIDIPSSRFIDSAVVARAMGAGGSLEAAAPQLLDMEKLEQGKHLIQLFSIPGDYQEFNDSLAFDPQIALDHPVEWNQFKEYCNIDSELGLQIVLRYLSTLSDNELANMAITQDMNNVGWPVDVETVEEMQRRYLENIEAAEQEFRARHDAAELNFNSLPQLKAWCKERGINSRSFDEKTVASMRKRIEKKLPTLDPWGDKYTQYAQVLDLLMLKQTLGGSSLKKLKVILDTVGEDGRLRDQYLHIGAGQTYRTTGRSVQMQNLKRLHDPMDMDLVHDLGENISNEVMAENLRQVFRSSHPQGRLVVGDFASVESRGLAWLAGARWKLAEFEAGQDMYKVLASNMFNLRYEQITKDQRQAGKVGELSCGYQAGGGAVQSFAAGMGIEMTEGEANQLVSNWRAVNPEIVSLWSNLDDVLNNAMDNTISYSTPVGHAGLWHVRAYQTVTPESLKKQHPNAKTIRVEILDPKSEVVLTRFFHGCYRRGRSICYYKPSQRKTGDLWSDKYTDPKTKQVKFYSIYGGKLSGILTQSLCREIFFMSLRRVHTWAQNYSNVDLIGQFHDEIVLDWQPPNQHQPDLLETRAALEGMMSDAGPFTGFPLAAEVKSDYRYTK